MQNKKILRPGLYLFFLIFFIFISYFLYRNYIKEEFSSSHLAKIQRTYTYKENLLSDLSEKILLEIKPENQSDIFSLLQEKSYRYAKNGFSFFVYVNDSLKSWTDNKVPVPSKISGDFSEHQITFLKNGWYRMLLSKEENVSVMGVFLIKHEFPYENRDLVNYFHPDFNFPYHSKIEFSGRSPHTIVSEHEFCSFNIVPEGRIQVEIFVEMIVLFAFILGIVFLLLFLFFLFKKPWIYLLSGVLMIASRVFYLFYYEQFWYPDMQIFQPDIYASSEWFPSFGDLVLNTFVLFAGLIVIGYGFRRYRVNKRDAFLNVIIYLLVLVGLALYTNYIMKSLVQNSNISFNLNHFFNLSLLSFVGLFIIGLHFMAFVYIIRRWIFGIKRLRVKGNYFLVFVFMTSLVFSFFASDTLELSLILWPFALVFFVGWMQWKSEQQFSFTQTLLVVLVSSFSVSFIMSSIDEDKEKENRLVYAERLVTDEDPLAEIEYDRISKRINQSDLLQKVFFDSLILSKSDLDDKVERRYFSKFWEKYDMSFQYFDAEGVSVNNRLSHSKADFEEVKELIDDKGINSKINPHIYFIPDYTKKINYVIFQPLNYRDSLIGHFVVLLQSKKIPKQIGFPTLLLDKNTKTIEELSSYSLARYSGGQLITKFGIFVYPLSDKIWKDFLTGEYRFVNYNEFDHLVYKINNKSLAVISMKSKTVYDKLTSFSYLFTYFGLLYLLFVLFRKPSSGFRLSSMSMNSKIQLLSISLVILALFAFLIGSGTFLREQYFNKTVKHFREKVGSVEMEIVHKLGKEVVLDEFLQNYSENTLKKLSQVFNTDINLYLPNGQLFASSRPRIFSIGLLSSLINADAYRELTVKNKSEFIHTESIGKSSYLSAYVPLFNKQDELLGYINLQYFSRQNELEQEMASLLVSIINIFVLLFAVSVVGTVFVSNWMTQPIKFVRQSLKRIELGKKNQIINYEWNDEIGDLVKEYNLKVSELEKNAKQLAQSERESAWREMAKQVAHEIKNPLTPMKLSIQHLQRSFDKNDPDAEEKIKKFTQSLIEQIDNLTHIANAFSNFAKLPTPQNEVLDLIAVVQNCVQLYEKKEGVFMLVESSLTEAQVLIDKSLITRVLNNLIINATQSIPEDREGKISIHIQEDGDDYVISIKDNGIGISESFKEKIFSPNFTTKSTGTGLGLAMVKNIIESYNGKVSFESEEGKGSVFYIRLPKNKISQ